MKQTLGRIFLKYLRFFARIQIAKNKLTNPHLKIVGITGSAGKSSTLLAAEAALTDQFKVKSNYGANSESGIPLNILGFSTPDFSLLSWLKIALLTPFKILFYWPKIDVYLLEMGIDSQKAPKNMAYLLSIVQPDIGIFLNVSPVHLENFPSLESIAQEKALLVNQAKLAIINPKDPLVKKFTKNPHKILIKPRKITLKDYYLPPIYSISIGAAYELANSLGMDKTQILDNLSKNFRLPASRASLIKGINDSLIIDSSYNSSPLATNELLKFLATFPSPKIAVLGDMRELGQASPESHQQLYKSALKSADLIISVGPETSRHFGPKAQKFLYWWQAADYLQNRLPPHSTILVKGSQNTIFLEELVKALIPPVQLNYYLSNHLICRQETHWLNRKSNFRKSVTLSTK